MDDSRIELFSFETEEHKHYIRSVDFYWTIGLIALVIVVLAFIFGNSLFGILIAIGVFMYGYVSSKTPNVVRVRITNKDILIGENLYPISKIESFRIMDLIGEKELVLSIRRNYQPIVPVCVPAEQYQSLRNVLNSIITEDTSLLPHIGRRMMAKYKI